MGPSPATTPTTATPPSETPEPHWNNIIFPRVYEQAWGVSDAGNAPSTGHLMEDTRTDMERARIFLLRFTQMSPDIIINGALREIAMSSQQYRTVPAIAEAVKQRICQNRHTSFAATPLLQCIRFMLIKARVTENVFSDRARSVIDFFFDPTLARNLEPVPDDGVVYRYPAGRLKVCIVGGGPTALASAISLAEKGEGNVEVHMYERRWVVMEGLAGPFIDYPPDARRRDQVVTLQDSVTSLMSPATLQALFGGRPEPVWPASANIQIRKVEDRLLKRCQDQEFRGLIHLHAEAVSREDLAKVGDFHVLLGADGAASWVRQNYFNGYENERGRSYALGLAFDRPAGLPWSQPLNVFLTLGQTRYLLNASDHDGRGYLNMQLTEDEWHKMVSADGKPVTFGRPGCLRRPDGSLPPGFEEGNVFAPSEQRDGALWQTIEDGLKLFGFKESEVINVVRIPIVVQAVQEGVQYLPTADSSSINRPHAVVAVAGDAAMTVHFWPGRGLNSGIKSGMALGDEMVHALNNGKFVGLSLDSMKEYNDFIMKLQGREHDKRSIPILNQSGTPETLSWLLEKAHSIPDKVAVEWLVGAMVQIASRLEGRRDWTFEPVANIEPQIRIVLRQLRSLTLREMAVSFPWPTREMGGAEVLPIRSMKPEEKQTWMNSLWRMLREDKEAPRPRPDASKASASRFEAPKQQKGDKPKALPPSPPAGGLRRTGATKSIRVPTVSTLSLEDGRRGGSSDSEDEYDHTRGRPLEMDMSSYGGGFGLPMDMSGYEGGLSVPHAPATRRSHSPASGDIGLVRLMSTNKRPGQAVLSDAMSLALFRLDE